MSEVVFAHGPMGGHTMLVFLPFIPLIVGILFLSLVVSKDKARNQKPAGPVLPDPRENPLREVHVALRSARKSRTPSRKPERDRAHLRPRHLRQL